MSGAQPQATEPRPSVDPWAGIQSRYVAYCRAHWAPSPEAMTERDQEVWPGGLMTGFILWIGRKWQRWHKETGYRGPLGRDEHAAFDAWLEGA